MPDRPDPGYLRRPFLAAFRVFDERAALALRATGRVAAFLAAVLRREAGDCPLSRAVSGDCPLLRLDAGDCPPAAARR